MKSIVVWMWQDPGMGARGREFTAKHVNMLAKVIQRVALPDEPHRFICITDKPDGLNPKDVEFFKMPPAARDLGNLRSPEGVRFPSCYRRLWNFSDDAKQLGDRLFCIDIDLVPTARWEPIYDLMPQDFVGWRPYRDWGRKLRYGGGSYLITPGTRTKVWTDFVGEASMREARAAGYRGSDQAWISYKLGEHEAYWPRNAGLYSVRDLGGSLDLPQDARLVQFNGNLKPWHYAGRTYGPGSWVSRYWR